ncbi:MAG: DUF4386 domain-containing protein [Caldilineaceae bacterium]
MNMHRKAAIVVGLLYLIATTAGLLGMGVFTQPVLDAPDYLAQMAAQDNQILLGALCEMIMAVAVAGIAVAVYPVLQAHSPAIAVGYVVARLAEAMIFVIDVICLLVLLTLGQAFVAADAMNVAYFHTLGEILLAVRDWSGHAVLDVAVFPLGAMLFYALLYRARLVPRWLSGWGLVAAPLYWLAGILVMFHLLTPLSTLHIALQAPLGLQELALAGWLIARGFTSPVAQSTSVQPKLKGAMS